MKKILITGSEGQLGYELQRTILADYECIATSRNELDITDADAVNAFVKMHHPAVIINSAAYTAVDKAEEETDLAIAINTIGAENLANAAKARNCKLVQISTDFVFDGKACSPYPVDAETNPDGYYGKTKRDGDNKVIDILGDEALIIRTSWLYSAHGNNFVKTIMRKIRDNSPLNITTTQTGTPTSCIDLADFIFQIITLREPSYGIYNFSAGNEATWYSFATQIASSFEEYELKKITPVGFFPTKAARPKYSVLDNTKARNIITKRIEWQKSQRIPIFIRI